MGQLRNCNISTTKLQNYKSTKLQLLNYNFAKQTTTFHAKTTKITTTTYNFCKKNYNFLLQNYNFFTTKLQQKNLKTTNSTTKTTKYDLNAKGLLKFFDILEILCM